MQRAILLTKMIAWMVVAGVLGGASFGQEYWKRQLPSDINMQFILPTSEGKFLLWGETDTTNILLKIEPNGNTLWMKTYGADIHSNVRWIQSLPDGTVFLTGNNLSAGEGNGDLWMCKLDSNGDSLWIKTMEVRQFQDFIISQPTPDGNFLFASDINDVLRLMEINENGDSLWMKKPTIRDSCLRLKPSTMDVFCLADANISLKMAGIPPKAGCKRYMRVETPYGPKRIKVAVDGTISSQSSQQRAGTACSMAALVPMIGSLWSTRMEILYGQKRAVLKLLTKFNQPITEISSLLERIKREFFFGE
jgi:hypothetical protein